jgi:hypothetical protein
MTSSRRKSHCLANLSITRAGESEREKERERERQREGGLERAAMHLSSAAWIYAIFPQLQARHETKRKPSDMRGTQK